MNRLDALLAVIAAGTLAACCQIAPWFLNVQTESLEVSPRDVGLFVYPRLPRQPHDQLRRIVAEQQERILDAGVLILYVHGRGDHPDAAYSRSELSGLESRFNAPVVLFHWPSWDGATSLPVAQAQKSGPYLRELLAGIAECREDLPGVRITLLVHSMGNRVLKAAMETPQPAIDDGSVDALVLCAADVDADQHAAWLTRCRFAREVYVLSNSQDSRLCIVEKTIGRRRLGQGVRTDDAERTPTSLASNAHYISLDGCEVDHDYFVTGSPAVGRFLRVIATNGRVDISILEACGGDGGARSPGPASD